jgi:hypothetical protein
VGLLGWRRNMKDDECGRGGYEGENMMTRTEYSVLKEVLKYDECGWSNELQLTLIIDT